MFVNTETFEVSPNVSGFIFVDKDIANSVARLNELGYKTLYSCSGHYKIEFEEVKDCEIQYLKETKNDPRCIIKEVNEKTFDYWTEILGTSVYILFDGIYDFPTLPDGFDFNENLLSHQIDFYDVCLKRKTREQIEEEIQKYNKILEQWTMSLSKSKER